MLGGGGCWGVCAGGGFVDVHFGFLFCLCFGGELSEAKRGHAAVGALYWACVTPLIVVSLVA